MKRSETTAAICKALAAAQGEMRNPVFDSVNPHFRNNFLSLAGARDAIVPILTKHGISVCQELTSVDGAVGCLTVLNHESGEYLEFGPLFLPVSKNDAQGFGSAATYCKRYSLLSVAGIVGDVDDDANAATGNPAQPTTRHDPRGDGWKKVDSKKVNEYVARIHKAVETGIDGRLKEIMGEVKEAGTDFRIAVWASLPKAVQDKIRDVAQEAA